jgi:hypothetical protein
VQSRTPAAARIPDTPEFVEFDPFDDLRQPFVAWFDARVRPDAEADWPSAE